MSSRAGGAPVSAGDERWVGRPWAAALVRAVVVVVPAVAGALVSWGLARVLPAPSGLAGTIGWLAVLVGAAVVAVVAVERLARRLLPLAWLLTLTLAFPDRAPSRLLTARRAASRRSRRQILDQAEHHGLASAPAEAAEQALVLVAALGSHDRRTRGHSERVRTLADVLAAEAGVAEADRDRFRWAALLHDIGKLTVPGEILNKPDRPDDREWAKLRRHPEEGGRLVAPLVAWLGPWAGAVGHHHERWDGSGYPLGLAGEEISLGGRILAVVDAYEVMTAARAYKQPMPASAAREELVAGAGSHFDPVLVRRFLDISLGRLRWAVGISALVAQLPLLGRLWSSPTGAGLRQGVASSATAAVVVTGLVLTGAVSTETETTGRQSASRRVAPPSGGSQVAAPATPPVPELPPTPTPPTPDVPAPVPGDSGETAPSGPGGVEGAPPATALPSAAPEPPAPGPERVAGAAGEPAPPGAPAPGLPPPPLPGDDWAFWARGHILAPGVFGREGFTESAFRSGCAVPESQGFDAWVFELPPSVGLASTRYRVTGRDALGSHRLEVAFFSVDCQELGREAPADGVRAVLPARTRYLVVNERAGVETEVVLVVFAAS